VRILGAILRQLSFRLDYFNPLVFPFRNLFDDLRKFEHFWVIRLPETFKCPVNKAHSFMNARGHKTKMCHKYTVLH